MNVNQLDNVFPQEAESDEEEDAANTLVDAEIDELIDAEVQKASASHGDVDTGPSKVGFASGSSSVGGIGPSASQSMGFARNEKLRQQQDGAQPRPSDGSTAFEIFTGTLPKGKEFTMRDVEDLLDEGGWVDMYARENCFLSICVRSFLFRIFIAILIIAYCVFCAIAISWRTSNYYAVQPCWFDIVNYVFVSCFAAEMFLRIFSLKHRSLKFIWRADRWFFLEFFIVIFLVIDSIWLLTSTSIYGWQTIEGGFFANGFVGLLRLFRIFVVLRARTISHSVNAYIVGFIKATQVLLGMFVVYVWVLFLFSVVMTQFNAQYKLTHPCWAIPNEANYTSEQAEFYSARGYTADFFIDEASGEKIDCETHTWVLDEWFSDIRSCMITYFYAGFFWSFYEIPHKIREVDARDMEIIYLTFQAFSLYLIMASFSTQIAAVAKVMNNPLFIPDKDFVRRVMNNHTKEYFELYPDRFPFKNIKELEKQSPLWYKELVEDAAVRSSLRVLKVDPQVFLADKYEHLVRRAMVREAISKFYKKHWKDAEDGRHTLSDHISAVSELNIPKSTEDEAKFD